jgi:hypothetical protein
MTCSHKRGYEIIVLSREKMKKSINDDMKGNKKGIQKNI